MLDAHEEYKMFRTVATLHIRGQFLGCTTDDSGCKQLVIAA